jgi:tetratricopeptide (TPR) repeat protein
METAANKSPVTAVEAEVHRIRGLLERKEFAAALAAAEELSRTVPENRDVVYMIAVSLRYLQKLPEALATLDRLEALYPAFSRLHQERGHCFVAMRDADQAIAAFLKAVNLNPALPGSWSTLQVLFRMTNQTENYEKAAGHVAKLQELPPDIVTATSMFSDGELAPAEAIIRAYLRKHGNDVEAMRLLAKIGVAHGVLDDPEVLLEAVLALAPDYQAARFDYAGVLLMRHKHTQAIEELEKLLKVEPENRNYRTTYAAAYVGLGDHERALALYRELLINAPRAADLQLSVAHSLKTLGRTQEAIDAYHAAAGLRPSFGDAYWSLANLKTYRFTPQELAQMRTEEAAAGTARADRYHLCFAIGKGLEDDGDYAESFVYYERGNALKKSESRYRPEPVEREAQRQAAICAREFFAARAGVGSSSPDPIFIVGLPRSGSTLIEQILASHSKIEGTMELADIPRLVLELQGREPDNGEPRYPRGLAQLKPEELRRLGDKYINDTRAYRTNRPYFIDKMPNNFRHIGLIHLILPRAKIIDARREPMACCFSNFKQLFASGQEFTYSLEDIGRYYRNYVQLMSHWDEALPGKVLRVQHEELVDDLEGNVRRLLDYLEVEFEPACLEFHLTQRRIRTASSEQVRQPISREGLDQWRNFEPWLAPLRAALGELAPAIVK